MANRQHRTCILLQQTRYNHSTIIDDMQALVVAAETSRGFTDELYELRGFEGLIDLLLEETTKRRCEGYRLPQLAEERCLHLWRLVFNLNEIEFFPEREAFPTFFG